MHYEMSTVATVLTRMGHTASYDDKHNKLVVDGVTIIAYATRFKNRQQIEVCSKKYTDYKHGGYKLHEMVRDIITALPELRKYQEEQAEKRAKALSLKELQNAHKEDTRLSISECYYWESEKGSYRVSIAVQDLFEAGVVCDMLREFTGFGGESAPKQEKVVPMADRRWALADDMGDPIPNSSRDLNEVAMIAPSMLCRAAEMVLGEVASCDTGTGRLVRII